MLKVIREKLSAKWQKLYEKNKIAEATAYKLAQLPAERQEEIYSITADANHPVYEKTVGDRNKDLDRIDAIRCKKDGGGSCTNRGAMKEKMKKLEPWQSSNCFGCCEKCGYLTSCKSACKKCQEKKKQLLSQRREAQKKEKAEIEARNKPTNDLLRLLWGRWNIAREKAGVNFKKGTQVSGTYYSIRDEDATKKIADGTAKVKPEDYSPYRYHTAESLRCLIRTADEFGCSTDYLLGRTEELTPPAAPAQQTLQLRSGTPDPQDIISSSVYWCAFSIGKDVIMMTAYWNRGLQTWETGNCVPIKHQCLGWIELPDYEGVLRK